MKRATRGRRNEHHAAVREAPRRHDAAHHRRGARRNRVVRAAAGLAPAAGRLPRGLGVGVAAGREPRGDGGDRRHSTRARPGAHRRRERDDVILVARQYPRDAPVRAEPRHQRRRARGAGRDPGGAKPAALEPAQQPDVPKGESGRRADHDPRDDLGALLARRDVRHGLDHPRAAHLAAGRRGPGDGGRRFATGRARGAQSHDPEQARHRLRRRAHRDHDHQREPAQGFPGRRQALLADPGQRPGAEGSRVRADHRDVPQRRRGAPGRPGPHRGQRAGPAQPRHGQRQARRVAHHQPAAQCEHHRDGGPGEGAAARAARLDPGGREPRHDDGAHRHDPRLASRSRAHAHHRRAAGDPRGVPLPAQRPRDADPGRGRADRSSERSPRCTCWASA